MSHRIEAAETAFKSHYDNIKARNEEICRTNTENECKNALVDTVFMAMMGVAAKEATQTLADIASKELGRTVYANEFHNLIKDRIKLQL